MLDPSIKVIYMYVIVIKVNFIKPTILLFYMECWTITRYFLDVTSY